MSSTWIVYNELAWTEDLLADPLDYEKEVKQYIKIINRATKEPLFTMLHLGSGAGGHDTYFKQHFQVTGARDSNAPAISFVGCTGSRQKTSTLAPVSL